MTDSEELRKKNVLADLQAMAEHYRNDYGRQPSNEEYLAQYPRSVREHIKARLEAEGFLDALDDYCMEIGE